VPWTFWLATANLVVYLAILGVVVGWASLPSHPSAKAKATCALVVKVLPVPPLAFLVVGLSPVRPVCPPRSEALHNVRGLALLLVDQAQARGTWPPYDGKNFVLSLVSTRALDPRNRNELRVLFGARPDLELPDATAYAGLTSESLRTQRHPGLTDLAGRRNTDPRYRLSDVAKAASEVLAAEPLLARAVGCGVLVGFADGSARPLTRQDLGLAPADPLVFGDDSASPLLRQLSDR
jgi:hypothetical protein